MQREYRYCGSCEWFEPSDQNTTIGHCHHVEGLARYGLIDTLRRTDWCPEWESDGTKDCCECIFILTTDDPTYCSNRDQRTYCSSGVCANFEEVDG